MESRFFSLTVGGSNPRDSAPSLRCTEQKTGPTRKQVVFREHSCKGVGHPLGTAQGRSLLLDVGSQNAPEVRLLQELRADWQQMLHSASS